MALSDENKRALLLHLHQTIADYARQTANHVTQHRYERLLNYPPNASFTAGEREALAGLSDQEALRTALAKILASNTADVFFDFFNVVDGTADPGIASGGWDGVLLVDYPEEDPDDTDMLHDDFFGTYWDWIQERDRRNQRN